MDGWMRGWIERKKKIRAHWIRLNENGLKKIDCQESDEIGLERTG